MDRDHVILIILNRIILINENLILLVVFEKAANRLKEAIGYIEDFVYDESAQIIKDIIPTIE